MLDKLINKRRSYRKLEQKENVDFIKLKEELENVVKNTPTAFNMQETIIYILTKENNKKLWNIVFNTLKRIISEDDYLNLEKKINDFSNGNGTILYFMDTNIVENSKKEIKTYSQYFDDWSMQDQGVILYAIWLKLTELGFDASIQHYNPIIDEEVKDIFNIRKDLKLVGQMPFGIGLDNIETKEKKIDERITLL